MRAVGRTILIVTKLQNSHFPYPTCLRPQNSGSQDTTIKMALDETTRTLVVVITIIIRPRRSVSESRLFLVVDFRRRSVCPLVTTVNSERKTAESIAQGAAWSGRSKWGRTRNRVLNGGGPDPRPREGTNFSGKWIGAM